MASHHSQFNQSPPNPLRPYYIPPPPVPFESSAPASSANTTYAAPSSYAILQDFHEYSSDYLDSPSAGEAIRRVLDQAILKYTSILISQPFEVAKTVLQCQYVPRKEGGRSKHHGPRGDTATTEEDVGDSEEEEAKEESEEDNPWTTFETEVCFYTQASLAPDTGPRKMTDRAGYVLEEKEAAPRPDYMIRKVNPSSVNDCLKALWAKEGVWGIWKGTNATFIHSVLVSTLEAWTTSFLSAVLSLPDPGVTEIADSTHPLASLGVAVAASALTALVLSPLDLIRTKLILTPASSKPRNLLPSLRTLPSYFIPPSLILPTTLHAVLPSFINLGTPYLLKAKLHLDPLLNPTAYNFLNFLSSSVELAVRLPLETVLRRAQIAEAKPERTIVPVGRYAGPIGTAWLIMKEEERGKWGIEGLYRGWRVGAWSNAGVLGLGLLGVQGGTTHEF
ncbi:mitochondrial carrier domain-containing protein [Sphaerosporella brunnea]|uniref:Mitochondrial carrier domain-containing protein n=1 Tax=Sphaerosporella brunnea TaxID=1250544 RepID=A0A5J5F364_9PEZI|nr:mitochondrial carrier domain-containing protein [Sphaerosporella brunnea]